MVTDEEKQSEIERMLSDIVEDDESMASILRIISGLKDSGSLLLLESLISKKMPGSTVQVEKLVNSNEMNLGILKLVDVLAAFMAAISQGPTSGLINSILYNSDDLAATMVNGAKKPDNYSLLRLMGMFKDPELAAGLTAVLNALKELGRILKTVG
ncbi:MAG: helical membrane plugin domain-containing protein [Thermoplasmataceae archaeon]